MHLQYHLELEIIYPQNGSPVRKEFEGVPRHAWAGVHLQCSLELDLVPPENGSVVRRASRSSEAWLGTGAPAIPLGIRDNLPPERESGSKGV